MNNRTYLSEAQSRRSYEGCRHAVAMRLSRLSLLLCVAVGIVVSSGCGSGLDDATNGGQAAKPIFDTPMDTGLMESLEVVLTPSTYGATIYYTTDGSDPNEFSNVYDGPIHIEGTTTIKARSYRDGLAPSEIAEADYSISGYPTGMLALDPTAYSEIPEGLTAMMGDLPLSVDLSASMPPAGNQGQQGSCVAWAVGYALKSYQENIERDWGANTPETQFSPSYIYNQIKVGSCLGGSYISQAYNLLQDQGCPTLATMPYDQSTCSTSPSAEARAEAQRYRIASWNRVSTWPTDSIRTRLAGGAPVVIGMRIYTNFYYLRGDQIYDRVEGSWVGNHAVCIVGYDDATSTYRVINSWGQGWGDQGYFRMTYDVFKQITFEAYAAQDIVEQTHSLVVTTSGDGTVAIIPETGPYYHGQTIRLTATAGDGWGFYTWEGDVTGWTNPVSVTMDSDKSITAVFAQDMRTLTLDVVGKGGTNPPAGQHSYVPGEEVTITATPTDDCERWEFSQWSGGAQGTASPITVSMFEDKQITAEFTMGNQAPKAEDQKLAVAADFPADVTLGGSDPEGDSLTYQITSQPSNGTLEVVDLPLVKYVPNQGFIGTDSFTFRVSDGCTQSAEGTVELFLDTVILYRLTMGVQGEGTADPPVGEWSYEEDTEVILTATPAAGWRFDRWEGDVTGTDASVTVAMDVDISVEAVFEIAVVVTVIPDGYGTVTLDPPGGSYTSGTWVTFTAQPGQGNHFAQWEGDLTGSDHIKVVKVESGMNVDAVFGGGLPSVSLLDLRTRVPWVVRFDMRLRDASQRAVVSGVTRDNFLIYEDGNLLDYTETNQFLTPGDKLPMKVMLVLDYTNSMKAASAIDDMIAAAGQFVQAKTGAGSPVFTATHFMGVVEFHDRTDLGAGYDEVVPLTRMDPSGKSQIVSAIPCENCREHGLSRVWDSVDLAMTKIILADSQQGEARAVVFLTDGSDTTSLVNPATLIATAKEHSVMLYPIGFGNVGGNEALLQSLAEQTGGMYYPAENAANLQTVFTEIARDLNGQWNLTYITQRNYGDVTARVVFDWQGTDEFTYTFDAGTIAGDIHTGFLQVLERTYDAGTDTTNFMLKVEYAPRSITYFHFNFGHAGATMTLQSDGGLTSDWTLTKLGDADYELQGSELQYGAFGNIGIVAVPGNVAKLEVRHDNDNAVYNQLWQQFGVTKRFVFEGMLWESF